MQLSSDSTPDRKRRGIRETAWTWLHKLRRAMVVPERELLSDDVEVDETYVGGDECRLPVPWDHPCCQKHGTTSRPQRPAGVMIPARGPDCQVRRLRRVAEGSGPFPPSAGFSCWR